MITKGWRLLEWPGHPELPLNVSTFPLGSPFCFIELTPLETVDNVMMEARNLRILMFAQTPLLGDENTPLHVGPEGGFESAPPRHQVAFTPNPLVTPRQHSSLDVPGSVSATCTPLWTPLRDTLSINPGDQMTPRNDMRDQQLTSVSDKRALKAGFMSLPRPENNFELLIISPNSATFIRFYFQFAIIHYCELKIKYHMHNVNFNSRKYHREITTFYVVFHLNIFRCKYI